MREAIKRDEFENWVKKFFQRVYESKGSYPKWINDALKSVGINLTCAEPLSESPKLLPPPDLALTKGFPPPLI